MTTDAVLPKPAGIARIVYKEILEGDRRKFEAQSNDAQTGGGARDLRFRPYDKFLPVFERLFPDKDENDICVGRFTWMEGKKQDSNDAFFHPPTNARPNEGRIASVDKFLPLNSLPPQEDGTTILMIIQRDDGTVWPSFTTDVSLASGAWHEAVSNIVLTCLRAHRRAGVSCCGYIDYETSEVFCNGK